MSARCGSRSARVALVATLMFTLGSVTFNRVAVAGSATVTYEAKITIPVPPSSSFAGSAGGDGWDVSMTPTAVYNVFHHNSQLQVACHLQVDASKCWADDSKVIKDLSDNNFTGPMHSGTYIDQATGKLYIFTTRVLDNTAGVVCVDTTALAADPNPFCGFTALSAVGDGGITSTPMKVGSKLYAFNYVSGQPAGGGAGSTANKLLCFDLVSIAACTGQPFAVNLGAGNFTTQVFPSPATAAIGGKIFVPTVTGQEILGCFDPATGTSCAGLWPITLAFSYASISGSAFPLLDSGGLAIGLCLPVATTPCFDFSGASVATPAGLAAVITDNDRWGGQAVTIGARVYVPNGVVDEVQCFNYATGASCVNFPKSFVGADLLYTVNADPQRPSCLWINSDNGVAQIQNFDAFSGGSCGEGATRVLSASFIVPSQVCAPTEWQLLTIDTPARNQYTSGSVDFRDADGNPISGVSAKAIDADGSVVLSGLALTSTLPQFLITLSGPSVPIGSVVVTLNWKAVFDPLCETDTVDGNPDLPPTGTNPAPFTVIAVGLIGVGALLLSYSRRRRLAR